MSGYRLIENISGCFFWTQCIISSKHLSVAHPHQAGIINQSTRRWWQREPVDCSVSESWTDSLRYVFTHTTLSLQASCDVTGTCQHVAPPGDRLRVLRAFNEQWYTIHTRQTALRSVVALYSGVPKRHTHILLELRLWSPTSLCNWNTQRSQHAPVSTSRDQCRSSSTENWEDSKKFLFLILYCYHFMVNKDFHQKE